jgi:hypothetical protein
MQGFQGVTGVPGSGGATGPAGPTAISTDAQNQSKLGSDNLVWTPPKIGKYRYYYCWHCDHPISTNQTTAAAGTGASAAQVTGEAGHPGIYNLVTGTTTTGSAYYASSTVADIQLGFFTKLAVRVVFKATYNWVTFGRWFFGLTDSLNTFPPVNGIIWWYDGSVGHAYLNRYNAGAATSTDLTTSLTSTGPGWLDWSIYWDSAGVKCRGGAYTGVTPPNPLFGPITTGLPATTTNLFWQVNVGNANDTASSSIGVDLVEICGELATPGGYRGEELVTAF